MHRKERKVEKLLFYGICTFSIATQSWSAIGLEFSQLFSHFRSFNFWTAAFPKHNAFRHETTIVLVSKAEALLKRDFSLAEPLGRRGRLLLWWRSLVRFQGLWCQWLGVSLSPGKKECWQQWNYWKILFACKIEAKKETWFFVPISLERETQITSSLCFWISRVALHNSLIWVRRQLKLINAVLCYNRDNNKCTQCICQETEFSNTQL